MELRSALKDSTVNFLKKKLSRLHLGNVDMKYLSKIKCRHEIFSSLSIFTTCVSWCLGVEDVLDCAINDVGDGEESTSSIPSPLFSVTRPSKRLWSKVWEDFIPTFVDGKVVQAELHALPLGLQLQQHQWHYWTAESPDQVQP